MHCISRASWRLSTSSTRWAMCSRPPKRRHREPTALGVIRGMGRGLLEGACRAGDRGTPSLPGDPDVLGRELDRALADDDPRTILARELGYLENNRQRMDYPRYRRLGLPWTTSHVESAVKMFNRRVKGSEKFWGEAGAETMLQLRAAYLSEDSRLDRNMKNQPCSPPPLQEEDWEGSVILQNHEPLLTPGENRSGGRLATTRRPWRPEPRDSAGVTDGRACTIGLPMNRARLAR